jgi:hypothetical protein
LKIRWLFTKSSTSAGPYFFNRARVLDRILSRRWRTVSIANWSFERRVSDREIVILAVCPASPIRLPGSSDSSAPAWVSVHNPKAIARRILVLHVELVPITSECRHNDSSGRSGNVSRRIARTFSSSIRMILTW